MYFRHYESLTSSSYFHRMFRQYNITFERLIQATLLVIIYFQGDEDTYVHYQVSVQF